MKIKEPVLLSKQQVAIYEVDVNGTMIQVTYAYDLDELGMGYWEYDLEPCYEGLSEEEIENLEEEFEEVIADIPL